MAGDIFCFVGLGNPGRKYERTRHNLGFHWVDALALHPIFSGEWKEKFQGLWCSGAHPTLGDWHLLKPQTYMNLSGQSVREFKTKYPRATIITIYDELDLPLGKIRFRSGGSDGGHRGMRSMIECLGTSELPRLRLGISREGEAKDFVLEKFTPEEWTLVEKIMKDAFETAETMVEAYRQGGWELAMTKVNQRKYLA